LLSVRVLMRLEDDFAARRISGRLDGAYVRWRARRSGVRRFAGLDDLIATCRDSGDGRWQEKDEALATLCAEAATGDQDAASLLLWLLLPGLLRERERIGAATILSSDELEGELLAGVWEGVTQVEPGARQVARTLLNRARWVALDAVRAAIGWASNAEPLPPDLGEEPTLSGAAPEQVLSGAVREGVLSPQETQLVMASRRTVREISARLGISLPAAQKRRHRARERLRAWLALSSREPPANLARRPPRQPPAETG
jgi:hypothetical protein